jgi:hypothetical protein
MNHRRIFLVIVLWLSACTQLPARTTADDRLRLHAQAARAERMVAQAPAGDAVIFVGAALDASSTAFAGDVKLARSRFESVAPYLATFQLGNGSAAPREWPQATPDTLRDALRIAGDLTRKASAPPRLVVVFLSSHGVRHAVSLRRAGERDGQLLGENRLARWLEPLGNTPTLLIVSACYSGSLIPVLQRPNRIILTAAHADRSSFGCDASSPNTIFADELFQALDPRLGIAEWFDVAVRAVDAREKRMGYGPPSMPQISIGAQLNPLAHRPLSQVLGAPGTAALGTR